MNKSNRNITRDGALGKRGGAPISLPRDPSPLWLSEV